MRQGAIDSILAGSDSTSDIVTLSLMQQIRITDSANKNTQTATVADMCPGCTEGDLGEARFSLSSALILTPSFFSRLDMSPALFTALDGNTADGVFQMTWQYIS